MILRPKSRAGQKYPGFYSAGFLIALITILFFSAGLISLLPNPAGAADPRPSAGPPFQQHSGNEFVPDQVIVKFKTGAASTDRANVHMSLATDTIHTSPYTGIQVVQIPKGKTVAEMVEVYKKQSIVDYAEPNYIDHIMWSPDDPLYPSQWNFGQINLESAWDMDTTPPLHGGDPGIIVAILDTGVAFEDYGTYKKAPDLANTNFVLPWNIVDNNAHPNDADGHGTHVCGTIAQSTNNALGVAGIAFNTSIMPVRTLGVGGGFHSQFSDGVHYAVDHGAKIINYSAGGSDSQTKRDACAYAYNNGVTIIAAAGNDKQNSPANAYPARYDDYCIAVGAVNYDRARGFYSNWGSYIDVVAPGGETNVDITKGILQQTFSGTPTNFGYYYYMGTSMAAPHVTGVAALILAKHPAYTPDQLRQALQSTATDLGAPGRDDIFGWGEINAGAAVAWSLLQPPILASPSDGSNQPLNSINFQWNPSAGATRYTLQVWKESDGSNIFNSELGNITSHTVNGFPNNGTVYSWRVWAGNAASWGISSAIWSFTNGLAPPPVPAPAPPIISSSSPQMPERFMSTPSRLSVKYLNVQPQEAQVNQPVTIYANIANGGDEAGTYSASLKVNGEIEETRQGRVGGHAAVPLQFVISRDKPGTYNVDINGQQTSFIVTGDSSRSDNVKAVPLTGFFLCLIGVIIVSALLIHKRIVDY